MRAVNLIPADQRRGAGGLAGRSGGVVYVLTGGLAVLVALGVVYALAVNGVATRKSELASVTAQVAVVSTESQALQQYVQFASVSATKVHEVATLAGQRFDWPAAMRQLALALPGDVTFTTFSATAGAGSAPSTGATAPAASGGTSFLLTGCASTQREIAEVLTNLFQVPGVSDVRLTSSVEESAPSKKKLARQAALQAALARAGGGCPLVTFTVALTYTASYTVPNSKIPKDSSGGAQTVSTSSGHRTTIVQSASHRSPGVTP